MPLTRPTTLGNRPDHLHIGRVDLEVARNTDGPGKFANREPWRNGALSPYPASAKTQPKRTPAAVARSISARAICGLVRAVRYSAGTPARSWRARLLVQLSGRNSRNASITGTSPRANVSDTMVWQLAVLPSAEAYCGATPTECVPFFGKPVSSTIQATTGPCFCIAGNTWLRTSPSKLSSLQGALATKWCRD